MINSNEVITYPPIHSDIDPILVGTAFQFRTMGEMIIARISFINGNDNEDRSIQIETSGSELVVYFCDESAATEPNLPNSASCIWTVKIRENWSSYSIFCGKNKVFWVGVQSLPEKWDASRMKKTNELMFAQGVTQWRYASTHQVFKIYVITFELDPIFLFSFEEVIKKFSIY